MPLSDDIRDLAGRILGRLDESRDFYLHTQQAWRVVQKVAHEGRSVGIVDEASGENVAAPDLEMMAQRYLTIHLAESVFKGLSGFLEDWVLGLARLWLTAYPVQAARDVLEHSRGLVGSDYVAKAGAFARHAAGDVFQIDEPYLLQCFALLRSSIVVMANAAIRRSCGPPRP